MINKTGDMFTTDTIAIGHGVNTQGVMGAGIARTFRERFPQNYFTYRDLCINGGLTPGEALLVEEKGKMILNIASQRHIGPDARYEWAQAGLINAAKQVRDRGLSRLAIPQIGCGIGGLDWTNVKTLIAAVEVLIPEVEFEVWTYDR